MWSYLYVRLGDLPYVISPTWDPPPSRKQALSKGKNSLLLLFDKGKTNFHEVWLHYSVSPNENSSVQSTLS